MGSTLINVRMDLETKQGFERVCKDLGMSMSSAVNIFAKKVFREKRIPFEVSVDPFYSEENMAHIQESISAFDRGEGITVQLPE